MNIIRSIGKFFHRGIGEHHDDESKRKIVLTNVICTLGMLCLTPLGVVDFFHGAFLLGVIAIFISLLLFNILIYLRITGDIGFCSYFVVIVFACFFLFLFFTGGVSGTGFMWHYSFPLLAFSLLGSAHGLSVTFFFFVTTAGFLGMDLYFESMHMYTRAFALRFISSFLFVWIISWVIEKVRGWAYDKMRAKEKMLGDTIFQLKNKKRVLGQAHEKLEQLLVGRTRELMVTNAKLKREINNRKRTEQERLRLEAELLRAQKMEAVGTLAGGVAHDLNNILSGLVSYPELLLLDIPEDNPMYDPLVTIKKSGEKASAIVQDLLTLARRGIPVKESVQLNDIIREYFHSPEFFKLQGRFPHVTLDHHLVPVLSPISGSPVHLAKSIMNLVTNAFEAIGEQGKVKVTTKGRYLDKPLRGYSSVEPGNYVVLTVKDTGVGMTRSEIDKIFEPFYTNKKMGSSGTGLGMTVVWGTVQDHDGYIVIDSRPGQGTAIRLYFPASDEDITDNGAKKIPEVVVPRGKGEKILVIDDIVEQREIAVRMLERLGYNVQAVASGEDALSFIRDQRVDLMLIDMVMDPGIDGLETYRQARNLYPGQKAIIASGYSESDRVRKAQDLGAGKYIKKPYSLDRIARAIQDELVKNEGRVIN